MNWEKLSDDRYMTDDGRYWAQFLDYPPDECWALWQAQEEPPAAKRSGRVIGFADTLEECKKWAAKRHEVGLR